MHYHSLKSLYSLSLLVIAGWIVAAIFSVSPAWGQTMVVRSDVHHDVSPPLRDLVKNLPAQAGGEDEGEAVKVIPLPPGFKPADEPDPVLQTSKGASAAATPAALSPAPTPLLNFDGIGQGVAGFNVRFVPPDTNGAAGLSQYVQWVNVNYAVFSKSDGSLLLGPLAGNSIWKGFGGLCETNNDGDPIVTYDKLADRWIFTQFVVRNPNPPPSFGPTFLQCVAVSTTSDATGSFNRYSFSYSNFDDYPKMGVWPDAYYVTFNMFNGTTGQFLGTDACAYNRTAMLNGAAATQICFQQAPTVGGVLPSDLDGHTPPPPGSPNYMVEFDVNSLNLYKFHVDFATPSNSSFSPAINIPVAPFTPLCPDTFDCVPQQGTFNMVDSLGDRLMYRLAYRNFGDHESLVVNHSVAVTVNGNPASGIRWYEIQNPGGTPAVVQQSTWAPDANYRWMGSIAMDQLGDMAVGYSVSSSTMFPSIAVAVRTPSDPPGTLQPEISVISGAGSETGFTRWGDYSAMQVDPVDDCTFWYTTEYFKTSGNAWNTRINSFKFEECANPDLSIAVSHAGKYTQNQTGATFAIDVKNVGGKSTDGSMVTVTAAMPTGLTATAASGTGWTCTPGSTTTCTRSDVLASRAAYPTITVTVNVATNAPGFVTNTATVSGGGEIEPSNDSSSDVVTVIQLGPDPTIAKSHSANFTQGQTGTYTITVTNAGLTALTGDPKDPVTVTDTLPTGLTANAASGAGWTCVLGPPVICTRSDTLASNASYPPISLVVNVARDAPPSVTNTVTVSGGGDVNPLNDTAGDPATVILVPNLAITKMHSGNFNQGQTNAQYTLTVSNAPGAAATSGLVTVTDTLPPGLTAGGANAFPWFCQINSNTLNCTRTDSLPAGSSYSAISLFLTVANDAPASVTNTATASGGGDPSSPKTATDPTTINPSPDLTIAMSHAPDPFTVGSTGTYNITVSNVGHASTVGTVNVNDLLPFGLTATSFSGTGWACPGLPSAAVNCTRSDALAAGSSYPVLALNVSVTGGGPAVTNTASVNGGGEFNFANDFVSDFTSINAPSLTITKSHTGNFTVGQTGAYTITVGNVGPIATIGTTVTVTDNLPFGLTATAVAAAGWSCSAVPTQFMTCTRSDTLGPNGTYPAITLTVSVDGNASATVSNFASVTGGGDSNSHLAQDFTVINVPDLTITKTHNGNFVVGQTGALYTITVSNVGTVATAGGTVTVQDFMPFGLAATAASGTGWTCSLGGGFFVNCTQPAGVLAPGGSYPPITLTVNVTSFNPFPITNTATVSGIGDANLNNNSASDPTTILPAIGITPTSPTTATVSAGTAAMYTFMVNLATNPPVGTVTFSPRSFGIFPPNAKVTFSPSSLTATGPVTMTVDTSGNGHVASLAPAGFNRAVSLYAALLLPLFGLLAFSVRKRKGTRAWLGAGMCICILSLLLAFSGCGGGGPPPPPPPLTVFTPPGTYSVTMTATSSNGSVPPTDMPVTLIVK